MSRHAADGSLVQRRWATGFSSPKGVTVADGVVYIADPKFVVALDVATGDELARYTIADAGLFNDVAVADDGSIYVTDTANPGLLRIDPHAYGRPAMTVVARDDRFEFPNGVTPSLGTAYVATTGLLPSAMGPGTPGRLFTVDTKSGEGEEIEGVHGQWDGVVEIGGIVVVNDFVSGEVPAWPT